MSANPIAVLLGIEAGHRTFQFDGHSFDYHPASGAGRTHETLCTTWADGSRSVIGGAPELERDLAALLAHRFRRGGVKLSQARRIIAEARAALDAK